MIRRTIHTTIDLVLDVIAEMWATFLDLGPHLANMGRRARARWSQRRAVPGWNDIAVAHDTETGADLENDADRRDDLAAAESGDEAQTGIAFLNDAFAHGERELQQI